MWTIEEFRIAIGIAFMAFMALVFVSCLVGQKLQEKRGKQNDLHR